MQTIELQRKWDLSLAEVEALRAARSGRFGNRTGRVITHYNGLIEHVQTSDWQWSDNIVTNQGLDHILDTELSGGTAITTWYIEGVKSNTTPAAGMTYATPTYTPIVGSDVTNTVRITWQDGGVSAQSVDNSASGAKTYTANATFTMYGASLVGGGTAASTIANTAGGGSLYAMALFGTSKSMVATDTIDITYTFTAADDGV